MADMKFLKWALNESAAFSTNFFSATGCTARIEQTAASITEQGHCVIKLVNLRNGSLEEAEDFLTTLCSLTDEEKRKWRKEYSSAGGGSANFFQNDPTALRAKKLNQAANTFAVEEHGSCVIRVPKEHLTPLMDSHNKQLLLDKTKLDSVAVNELLQLQLFGSEEALSTAKQVLKSVVWHCQWGISSVRVTELLSRRPATSIMLRLSPMNALLKPFEKIMNAANDKVRIGKDKTICQVICEDNQLSRKHALIFFDSAKGSVYLQDQSTNGTYLNGHRLPLSAAVQQAKGKKGKDQKVRLFHGDEILFKNPNSEGCNDYGFIVNVEYV